MLTALEKAEGRVNILNLGFEWISQCLGVQPELVTPVLSVNGSAAAHYLSGLCADSEPTQLGQFTEACEL
jgi:hypothetical protein